MKRGGTFPWANSTSNSLIVERVGISLTPCLTVAIRRSCSTWPTTDVQGGRALILWQSYQRQSCHVCGMPLGVCQLNVQDFLFFFYRLLMVLNNRQKYRLEVATNYGIGITVTWLSLSILNWTLSLLLIRPPLYELRFLLQQMLMITPMNKDTNVLFCEMVCFHLLWYSSVQCLLILDEVIASLVTVSSLLIIIAASLCSVFPLVKAKCVAMGQQPAHVWLDGWWGDPVDL